MGVTGAGKSTFISLLTRGHVEVGHDLQSSEFELPVRDGVFKANTNDQQRGMSTYIPSLAATIEMDASLIHQASMTPQGRTLKS
jgi:hypothetical protein